MSYGITINSYRAKSNLSLEKAYFWFDQFVEDHSGGIIVIRRSDGKIIKSYVG